MNEMALYLGKVAQKIKISRQFSPLTFFKQMEPYFVQYGYRHEGKGQQEILVISLNAIGDNIVYSAFIRELRRNYPTSVITMVVNPTVYALYEYCPYVNKVLSLPYSHTDAMIEWLPRFVDFAQENLLEHRYDKSLYVQWSDNKQQMNFLAYISGARERYGISDDSIRAYNSNFSLVDQWEHLLTNPVVTPVNVQHEAERALYMLTALGKKIQEKQLELWLTETDFYNAVDLLQRNNVKKGQYIVLGIGAREANRKYPLNQWVAVINGLYNRYGFPFVICGGEDERQDGEVLSAQFNNEVVINLAGRTTLRGTGAIIACSMCYLGNVTGMMHMAAALAVPLVCLFREAKMRAAAPEGVFSEYIRFAPWHSPSIALRPEQAVDECAKTPIYGGCVCRDRAHCLATIDPHDIVKAVTNILG